MSNPRLLRQEERQLIHRMLTGIPGFNIPQLQTCHVEDMSDGGMGSVRFVYGDTSERKLGKAIAELKVKDVDGVDVLITINIDDRGELYELDIWKVDFTPL